MSLVDYDRCRGVKVNCKKRRASSFLTPHSSWLSHQIILEQCVSGWGPSINDVGSWEGGRGQKLVKIADMGEGGVKNLEKLQTSFMDAPWLS